MSRTDFDEVMIADPQTGCRKLKLSAISDKPDDFGLRRVQLETIGPHPVGDLINAGGDAIL